MCEVKSTSSVRKGGCQQHLARLRRDRSRSPSRDKHYSELGTEMIIDYSLGRVKARSLQKYGAANVRDGSDNHAMHKMATIGTSGANAQNIKRDLTTAFGGAEVRDVLINLDSESIVKTFLYPHTIFNRIALRRDKFVQRFGARRTWLRRFWSEFRTRPHGRWLFANHKHLVDRSENALETTIPLLK